MTPPLSPRYITSASRVMLRVYPLFFSGIGASLVLTDQDRLRETPVFNLADRVVDLRLWGLAFLLIGCGLALSWFLERRDWYRTVLSIAVDWMAAFAVFTLGAAFFDRATFAAWLWPGFVAVACWASLVSITSGEIGEPR